MVAEEVWGGSERSRICHILLGYLGKIMKACPGQGQEEVMCLTSLLHCLAFCRQLEKGKEEESRCCQAAFLSSLACA